MTFTILPPRSPSGVPKWSLRAIATLVVALAVAGAGRRTWAVPAELARAVPDDVVAAYFVGGSHDKPPEAAAEGKQSSFEFATFLIDQAFDLGFLSAIGECTRAWLDALASVSVVLEHPHAVMLFDIRAEKTDEDSHRLAGLNAALVMHTKGRNERIEHRIQHLLGSFTNQDETTLETIEREGATTYRLRDRRLADWFVLTWGCIGDDFIVAIGDGSFDRVAAALQSPSSTVAADPWFLAAVDRLAAQDALFTLYVRYDQLRQSSRPELATRIDRVLQALQIGGCERGLWAVGYAGRAVEIRQSLRIGSSDESTVIAGAAVRDAPHAPLIPDSATAFAAIDMQPAVWFDRVRNAYLAGRSPANRARSCTYWRDIESRAGISFADDIFAFLDGPIVVHDFPKHALRLPPAWTIVAPIKGDADRLRRSVDGLLKMWQLELDAGSPMRLRHDDDGVWHLVVGVEGPALLVTDRNLLISFSPQAVRQNLDLLARLRTDAASK